MRARTLVNTQTYTLLLAALEILPPNPYRKAFLLSPLAAGPGGTQPITAVVFTPGAGQSWQVPYGVTQVVDVYVWGSGGNPGAPGAVLGGGGGGGGGFASLGPLSVVPGSVFAVDVGAAGGSANSGVTSPTGSNLAIASPGLNGLLDAAGGAGTGVAGASTSNGGNGAAATALAGAGAGGGGAGGRGSSGSNGATSVGGAGGGAVTISTYGVGGTGGAGGASGIVGLVGATPGAGGGGSGNLGAAAPGGAPGMVVIFYVPSDAAQAISLSPRQDVAVGQGILNYLPGAARADLINDDRVGSGITEPWYAISGVSGIKIQVVEYSYEPGSIEPAY